MDVSLTWIPGIIAVLGAAATYWISWHERSKQDSRYSTRQAMDVLAARIKTLESERDDAREELATTRAEHVECKKELAVLSDRLDHKERQIAGLWAEIREMKKEKS